MSNVKFTFEIKLKAVKRIVLNHECLKPIARELGCTPGKLRLWRNIYLIHGPAGLWIENRSYSSEFISNVIKYIKETGCTIICACAKFRIPNRETVKNWLRRYDSPGSSSVRKDTEHIVMVRKLKHPAKKHPSAYTNEEIQKLIEENEQLRMENDFLKKLDALTQEHPEFLGNGEQPEQ